MTTPDASPTTEPTAPAPHRTDTQTKYYIAIIALIATLAGAVAGVWGAIHIANVNADTQTKIAKYNVARTQNQTAFASFITDESALTDDLDTMYDALLKKADVKKSAPAAAVEEYKSGSSKAAADMRKLKSDSQLLGLLSPGPVADDAGKLIQADDSLLQDDDSRFEGPLIIFMSPETADNDYRQRRDPDLTTKYSAEDALQAAMVAALNSL